MSQCKANCSCNFILQIDNEKKIAVGSELSSPSSSLPFSLCLSSSLSLLFSPLLSSSPLLLFSSSPRLLFYSSFLEYKNGAKKENVAAASSQQALSSGNHIGSCLSIPSLSHLSSSPSLFKQFILENAATESWQQGIPSCHQISCTPPHS
jgi:hypothetical protein